MRNRVVVVVLTLLLLLPRVMITKTITTSTPSRNTLMSALKVDIHYKSKSICKEIKSRFGVSSRKDVKQWELAKQIYMLGTRLRPYWHHYQQQIRDDWRKQAYDTDEIDALFVKLRVFFLTQAITTVFFFNAGNYDSLFF